MDLKVKTEQLLKLKDDSDEFISALLAIRLEAPEDLKVFEAFLVALINENDLNLITMSLAAVQNGQDVFRVVDLLKKCISKINIIKPEEMSELFIVFAEKMKNDMFVGMFFEPIRELSREKPLLADEIANSLLAKGKHPSFGYINAIYLGLLDSNFQTGYQKILGLLAATDPHLVGSGLRAIGLIPEIPEEKKGEIVITLRKMALDPSPPIVANSAFAICQLSKRFPELIEDVKELSKSPAPEVKYQIAAFLNDPGKTFESWMKICLVNLCDYDLSYKGLTDQIDYILYRLAKSGESKTVMDVLSHWIKCHNDSDHRQIKINELFGSAIREILKDKKLTGDLFVEWINSDDFRFHHCIAELTSHMKLYGVTPPAFDKTEVSKLNYDDLIYVVRKILGWISEYDYSANLIFSLLQHENPTDELEELVVDVFAGHFGYNHSEKALGFLESKFEGGASESIEAKVARRAVDEIKERLSSLAKLERLNELLPRLDDQIEIDRAFQKLMSREMAKAQSKSPLLSMVKKVSLKQGAGWFSYHHGKYSPISMLGKFSESLEIPRGDVLDAVGASIARSGFRRVGRGQE